MNMNLLGFAYSVVSLILIIFQIWMLRIIKNISLQSETDEKVSLTFKKEKKNLVLNFIF